jgi:hypothetical protein
MRIQILRSSASGIYSGEVYHEVESRAEANEWLNAIADKREARGFETGCEYDAKGNYTWMEFTHDNLADTTVYIVREVQG